MSKYKIGDKFIIEIGHGIVDPLYGARYFIKGFNTLVFDDNELDKLEKYDVDAKANADYNVGYEDGLHDAWECAKIIENSDAGENYARFGEYFTDGVFNKFSASEVKNKIVEYEAKQAEIKVGDEIINEGDKGVVTRINLDTCDVIWFDGSVNEEYEKNFLRKTGRHYDIDSILEQLKGADDE